MTYPFDGITIERMIEAFEQIEDEPVRRMMEIVFNSLMLVERERHNKAGIYERTLDRTDHSNGFKPKKLKTRVGILDLKVPQTRSGQFYPKCLEKGSRTERALRLAVAEMYLHGVSTRKVRHILGEMAEMEISSSEVSRCTKLLDEEFQKWRSRPIGCIPYLFVDARYEKVRVEGVVRDVALLNAIGIDTEGKRLVLGVSVSLSEAEVHWNCFLSSLRERGLHGVQLIVSDDHQGLGNARKRNFGSVPWQRCLFHLQQNAQHHCSKQAHRKLIAQDIRDITNASKKSLAEELLKSALKKWSEKDAHLASWLEQALPESLTFYNFPKEHRKRLRTNNSAERYNRELARRTNVVTLFPNESSLLRLATAQASEISDDWETGRQYLNMNLLIQDEEI
jgi:transposase-like protein